MALTAWIGAPASAQQPAPDAPTNAPPANVDADAGADVEADAPAGAAPAEGAAPAAPPALEMPEILTKAEPVYPPAAFEQGLQAEVVVQLTILPDGTLGDAKVVQPVGHGFDEAALQAVKQFTFKPARKNGAPIGARMNYSFFFEITEEERKVVWDPNSDAPPPPAGLSGQVLSSERDRPLAEAEVIISTEDGSETFRAVTDLEGKFSFEDLTPGLWIVRVARDDRTPLDIEEELAPGQLSEAVYRLEEPEDPEAFGAVARVAPPPREVTRRSIDKTELTRIPGTRGDALRAVELLPGVARPPLGAGLLVVRGSAPADTLTYFDGIPVQLLYHFGGLTSFINSRMIESLEFVPGNFSARFGRRRGAVVEVRSVELPRDEVVAVADLNFIDASLLVQAPITDELEIGVAARRSYLDVTLGSALEGADISTVAAPVYYDYQLFASYRPSDRHRLKVMLYGLSDEFELLFQEQNDADAAFDDLDVSTAFNRVHASWDAKLSDRVDQEVSVAVNDLNLDFGFGELVDFSLTGAEIYSRAEWRGRVTDKVQLIGGLDLYFLPGEYVYQGPPPQSAEGSPAARMLTSNSDQFEVRDEFVLVQPAGYVESSLNLHPMRLTLGSRLDYFDEIEEFTFDPRISAHLSVTDSTTLRGGVGMYSQPPEFPESAEGLGNPDLEPAASVHTSMGAEQTIGEGYTVSADGFYKHLFDVVVNTEFGQAPFFTNDAEGRIYGLELAAKAQPRGRFFGYLSYTLSRSQRKDRPGQPWRLFDFDQTHILTVSGTYRLGRGWEMGGTFRLVSGNPDTPIIGSSYNATTGLYAPLYGRTNTLRNPMFNRLDVRVEKQWKFTDWKLAAYLDLQNAYNADNPEGRIYDYEFREYEDIRGFPIFPNLGVRGEM